METGTKTTDKKSSNQAAMTKNRSAFKMHILADNKMVRMNETQLYGKLFVQFFLFGFSFIRSTLKNVFLNAVQAD